MLMTRFPVFALAICLLAGRVLTAGMGGMGGMGMGAYGMGHVYRGHSPMNTAGQSDELPAPNPTVTPVTVERPDGGLDDNKTAPSNDDAPVKAGTPFGGMGGMGGMGMGAYGMGRLSLLDSANPEDQQPSARSDFSSSLFPGMGMGGMGYGMGYGFGHFRSEYPGRPGEDDNQPSPNPTVAPVTVESPSGAQDDNQTTPTPDDTSDTNGNHHAGMVGFAGMGMGGMGYGMGYGFHRSRSGHPGYPEPIIVERQEEEDSE